MARARILTAGVIGLLAVSVAVPSVAGAKTAPLVLENGERAPLAVGTSVAGVVAVYYGEEDASCTYVHYGSLLSNGKPKDTASFSGEPFSGCSEGATSGGSITKITLTGTEQFTVYAKPKLSIALGGCTYEAAKLILALHPIGTEAEAEAHEVPFKRNTKLSSKECAATHGFYVNAALDNETEPHNYGPTDTDF